MRSWRMVAIVAAALAIMACLVHLIIHRKERFDKRVLFPLIAAVIVLLAQIFPS